MSKSNLEHKLHIYEIFKIISNTKWKDCKSHKNFCPKNFTYMNIFYLDEIAAKNLSKIYFLKNPKKTCKPKNHDLNHDWINDFAVCKHCSGTLLLVEDVTSSHRFGNWNYILQKGARLSNPNLGGLFRGSFRGGGGRNYPLSKTCWNYTRIFKFGTLIFSFRKYTF